MPQFGESAYDDLARFASTAEQLGADSLWVGDRRLAAVEPTVRAKVRDHLRLAVNPERLHFFDSASEAAI